MKPQILELFPLTIFSDQILMSESERKKIIQHILNVEKKTENIKKSEDDAWVGDRKGDEFLLKKKIMHNLANLIGDKIRLYIDLLNIDKNKIQIFLQRSWATVTRNKENIKLHSHDQSNISFAYYPLKPKKSGHISFFCQNHPNEIANGLFHQDALNLGILNNITQRNAQTIDVNVQEGCIVIFPSKTKHYTKPNFSNEPRISISGDVSIVLNDSFGFEKFMPHFQNWQIL